MRLTRSALRRAGRLPTAAVDMAAMAYMYAMVWWRVAAVTVVLAAWFAIEALGWASARLSTAGPGAGSVPAPGAAEAPGRGGILGTNSVLVADPPVAVRRVHRSLLVRGSLVVMSVGMAYMLLAMQFGMRACPMRPGMPGM